jgi:hypothetical protein
MNLKSLAFEHLPTYNLTLPYSKIKTKFRPFLVKEEKKLLILEETSSQNEIYQGIIDVLNSCFDNINFENIPLFEVEYCFLKLRSKSVGETLTPKITCPYTNENHLINVNIDNIQLNVEKIDPVISLEKNIKIKFNYPTVFDIVENEENINKMVANCVSYIETHDERAESADLDKEELVYFFDHMTPKNYDKILEFFNKMPRIELDISYLTSDGISRNTKLKGLKDFFS